MIPRTVQIPAVLCVKPRSSTSVSRIEEDLDRNDNRGLGEAFSGCREARRVLLPVHSSFTVDKAESCRLACHRLLVLIVVRGTTRVVGYFVS